MAYLGVIGTTEDNYYPAMLTGDVSGPFAFRVTADVPGLLDKIKPLVLAPDGRVGEVFAPGTLVYL